MMAPISIHDSAAVTLCNTARRPRGNATRCPIHVTARRLARTQIQTYIAVAASKPRPTRRSTPAPISQPGGAASAPLANTTPATQP